jgi:hypothetical protein
MSAEDALWVRRRRGPRLHRRAQALTHASLLLCASLVSSRLQEWDSQAAAAGTAPDDPVRV